MANRYYNNQAFTLSPAVVKIFARVTFGAAGAPTLVQGPTFLSKGVVSVSLSATSTYTFVFGTQTGMLDVYPYLLDIGVCFDATGNAGSAPAAPLFYVSTNSVATAGTCSVAIITTNNSGSATVPSSGEAAWFEFTFKNSTAP